MEAELRQLSNRIKEMRKVRNVTQKQLAEALDISVTNMCNIENGKTAVTIQNLIKMKNFFSCEMKDFFTEPEVKEIKKVKEAEKTQEQAAEVQPEPPKLPEAIELQDAINLLRLLRRVDISAGDIKAGKAAGCKTCLVKTNGEGEFADCNADVKCNTVEEFVERYLG